MNDIFNTRRFARLCRKTLMERPAQLIGLTTAFLGFSLLTYAFCKFTAGFEEAQRITFTLGLIGGGCFLASFVFGPFSTNAGGSSFLTLPASQFEKWLTGVLITGVFYVGLFILFFRLMDITFISIYHKGLDPKGPYYKELYDAVQPMPLNDTISRRIYAMFANFAGAMLIGTLYFNKAAFIKVALFLCALCLVTFLFNLLVAHLYFQNVDTAFPYYLVWINVNKSRGRLELPPNILDIVGIIFQYVIPITLWILAYVRLREKEF